MFICFGNKRDHMNALQYKQLLDRSRRYIKSMPVQFVAMGQGKLLMELTEALEEILGQHSEASKEEEGGGIPPHLQ